MTEQELAAIEASHKPYEVPNLGEQDTHVECGEDGLYWPCDAIQLLAEVRRLRRGYREMLAYKDRSYANPDISPDAFRDHLLEMAEWMLQGARIA